MKQRLIETRPAAWYTFTAACVLLGGVCARDIHTLIYGARPYRVYGSFWESGQALFRHFNPYGLYPLTWHFHPYLHDVGPVMYDVNLSPPVMMPLFQFAALFPIRSGVILWSIISTALFMLGSALLVSTMQLQKRQIVWLLLSSCVTDTIWFGQDYSLMFFMACLIWYFIYTDKPIETVVCIGLLIAMKPNLGLWPIMLFFAGYKRQAYQSAVIAAALSLIPVFLYGPSIYSQWLRANSQTDHHIFTSDLSIIGIFTRMDLPHIGVALSIATGIWLILSARQKSEMDVAGIAVCAGILCAPLAWHQYVMFAAPFFVNRKWSKAQTFAAVLMATPSFLTPDDARLTMFLVTVPHIIGLGIMLRSFVAAPEHITVEASNVACVT